MRGAPGPHGVSQGSASLAASETTELSCSYDLRGQVIEVNEALSRVLGYPPQELRGQTLTDLLDPESWESVRQNLLQHLGGACPGLQQLNMRSKAGPLIPIEMGTRLVFEKGTPVAVQAFGRQLVSSERHALLEAENRLTSTAGELARFTEHLKHLHRLSTTAYESLDHIFADCLQTGYEIFHLALGLVLEVDGADAIVRAVNGGQPRFRREALLPLAQTHFASIPERLRTTACCDARTNSPVDPWFQICLATPILADSDLYGTLSFSARYMGEVRVFSQAEKDIVELMASSIGRFIHEDRIQQERRATEMLERRRNGVLEMVAENRPLPQTLFELERLVEGQCPGATCSIIPIQSELRTASGAADSPLEVSHKQQISSAAGTLLGDLVLMHPREAAVPPVEPEVLRMASRLASIAIEQRQLTDRLAYQAQHDFLTGLPNRFRLLALLEQRLIEANLRTGLLAVAFIDLDRFKQINDTLGHPVGDRLLIEVAERLKSGLGGPQDVAARMGGDEFTVILTNVANEEEALHRCRQLLDALRSPYLFDGRELFVTASIGVSFFPQHGVDAPALLRTADSAMYRAKKDGKNALECFVSETREGAIERLDLENALRRALEKSEFELFFQPIVSMEAELDGFEVLLTWNHATRGRISPNEFIPMAEETGLIVPIGSWVLLEACRLGAGWQRSGLPLKRIAVNVSALQFARPNFVETVSAALLSTGFPPKLLEFELTESLVLRDIGESIHRMTQLQELGVTMAIDDFGTGYSSLNYLRRLPVNELKIDKSFLQDLRAPSGALSVVETIVSLAHQMKLSVVAEGVETLEELELLRTAGCDKVQGHLFGGSLSAHEVAELLARADRRVPIHAVCRTRDR